MIPGLFFLRLVLQVYISAGAYLGIANGSIWFIKYPVLISKLPSLVQETIFMILRKLSENEQQFSENVLWQATFKKRSLRSDFQEKGVPQQSLGSDLQLTIFSQQFKKINFQKAIYKKRSLGNDFYPTIYVSEYKKKIHFDNQFRIPKNTLFTNRERIIGNRDLYQFFFYYSN